MLILAGVSINAIVGENGVLTKAQKATIENKKAGILEAIDLELASYNIDTILNNPEQTSNMLTGLMNKNVIDTVLSSTGQTTDASKALAIPQFDDSNSYTGYTDYGVMKEDYSILLSVDMSGIYKASFGEVNVSSGGSVAAGTTVVTGDAFNSGSSGGTTKPEDQGKFVIDNDASVMFVDEIGKNGEELSIQVKSGVHAKVNIFKNMTLTNQGMKRSAIDIEPGGTLDLYVADNVKLTVNSGFSTQGATGNMGQMKQNEGGKGGYAGIRVPFEDKNNNGEYDEGEYGTLNLYGKGTVVAYGGNASAGGAGTSMYETMSDFGNGGGGGGGAGAGIGGNGGNGGESNSTVNGNGRYQEVLWNLIYTDSGHDGYAGEDCGKVNIYNNVTVYAYGGAGSNTIPSQNTGTNSGGSGYPAAGIGGGGAGGRWWRLGKWCRWICRDLGR